MKRNIISAILLLSAVAFSCTTKEEASKSLINDGSVVYNPTVAIAAFEIDGPATKTVLTIDESSGAKFTFVDGDALGVYPYDPEKGDQVRFTVKSSDASSCTFNGSGYGLMAGQQYAAYYPADLNNASKDMVTKIPVDYTKQRQTSTDGTSFNISEADYLVSNGISPVNNACDFTMSHLGALLVMDVTFAEAGNYKELKLTSTDAQFVRTGEVDLTAAAITIDPDASGAATLALGTEGGNGLSISANQTVRFCMMVAPVNLKSSTVTITLTDSENVAHTGTFKNGNFKAGKAYLLTASVTSASTPEPAEPINLSANGTANSYIVSEAGDYYFNATVAGNGATIDFAGKNFAGAGQAYPSGGVSNVSGNGVKVVLNQNNCIQNARYDNGAIFFTATGAEGNAKVTLTDGGSNVWTWLVWCTDQPGTIAYTSPVTKVKYEVMDRNMGATTNAPETSNPGAMYGLYYQFGNPIGYTFEEYSQGDLAGWRMIDALAYNPNKPFLDQSNNTWYWFNSNDATLYGLLWGGGSNASGALNGGGTASKTMYDPCPLGYKVTPFDTFYLLTGNITGNSEGLLIQGTSGQIFIPYNGAAWQGGNFWMSRGAYCSLWTSGMNNTNMAWCCLGYKKNDTTGAGAEDGTSNFFTQHILTRGFGVRCVKE